MSETNTSKLKHSIQAKPRHWHMHKTNRKDSHDDKVLSVELENESGTQSMSIRWDGCCDYFEYSNGFSTKDVYSEELEQNTDYLHICDMKRHIKEMQEIVDIAERVFSEEDFKQNWK